MVYVSPSPRSLHPRDEEGAIAVLSAIVMVVMVLFVAIVVDLGNARDVRRQSQNGADAASLAGANALYPSTLLCQSTTTQPSPPCLLDAEAAVKAYAQTNFQVSSWSGCNAPSALAYVPIGETSCISYDSGSSPQTVRVYMPTRTVATFFGQFAGTPSIPVGSTASASFKSGTKCSLCIFGDVNAGNGDFDVTGGGSIAVKGDVHTTASAGSVWNALANGIVGTVTGGAVFNPPRTVIPPFSAPILTLPLSPLGPPVPITRTNPCASVAAGGGPGLYTAAVSLPNSLCTLLPGLYVISGAWDMKNNTVLSAPGVTLYVKNTGSLDFKNGNIGDATHDGLIAPLTAPLTGVPAGYAIIYDPNNHTDNCGGSEPPTCMTMQGNGGTSITGMVYAPEVKLALVGTSCFGFDGGPIVIGGVSMNGTNGCVNVAHAREDSMTSLLLHLNG